MTWSKPWQNKDGEDIKGQYTYVNIYTKDEVKEEITTVVDNHGAEKVQLNNPNFISTDVNGALEELFISVGDGKSKIATAITDKGINASGDESFDDLSRKISSIQSGGSQFMNPMVRPADVEDSIDTWRRTPSVVTEGSYAIILRGQTLKPPKLKDSIDLESIKSLRVRNGSYAIILEGV